MTSSNTYGRQVVLPLTNQSGGGVIAGDVVVIDTANNGAFTTNTAGAFTGGVGIVQETIAALATGRVLISGYAALVNVNASVTRGYFGKTHTVAKQAASAGAARAAGTFCQFLTGGTTPDALVFPVDLLGSSLTNPMTAVGDIIQGAAAGAPAALAAPLAGKVLTGAGVTTALAYAYPPGYEFDYVEITSSVAITGTTEGAPTTVVTGGSVAYDGSTIVMIEFWAPRNDLGTTMTLLLYEDSTLVGRFGLMVTGHTPTAPVNSRLRRTPSNASHSYTVKAYCSGGDSTVAPGAGGSGEDLAAFIRVTKV